MKSDTEILAEILEKDFNLKNLSKKLHAEQEKRDKKEDDFHNSILEDIHYTDRYGSSE